MEELGKFYVGDVSKLKGDDEEVVVMHCNAEDARMPFPKGDAHCPVLGGIDFDENHEMVIKED